MFQEVVSWNARNYGKWLKVMMAQELFPDLWP